MTTIAETAEQLTTLLQRTLFGDESDREIDPTDRLGEDGIGLDSLGFVQFLTATETEFGIALPIDVWTSIDQVSINELAESLIATQGRR